MSFEIFKSFLVDNVSFAVLKLFLVFRFPGLLVLLQFELLPQRHGVLDLKQIVCNSFTVKTGFALFLNINTENSSHLRHVGKMRGIWNPEAPHSVRVSPLGEVALERLGPLVGEVSADLAVVRDVEAVQLVQPVRDGLAVPA